MPKKYVICEWEIFTISSGFYAIVDFKKFESDLFHAGSTLTGSECIKRKTRNSPET